MQQDKTARIELESERFLLRPMTLKDITPDYVGWWNDAQLQEGLSMPARDWNKNDAVKHLLKFNNRTSFHLGIFRKGDGQRQIGFVAIIGKPKLGTADVNILIGDRVFWGKRVPEEILMPVFGFIFDRLRFAKACIEVAGHNRSSLAMCRRLGFVCEGVLRSHKPHFSGEGRVDVHHFSMLREEWEQRKRQASGQ